MSILGVHETRALVLYMPDFFKDPVVRIALTSSRGIMTWCRNPQGPDEHSDVVVHINSDLSGSGYDQGWVPRWLWDQIVDACRCHFDSVEDQPPIAVRLINQKPPYNVN